jgi:hypothetical protein
MNKIEFETKWDSFGDPLDYFEDDKFIAEIIQIDLEDDDDCYFLIIKNNDEIIIDENGTFDEMKSIAQDEYDKYKESEK